MVLVYLRALNVLPSSLLLHFQFCDFLELGGNHEEADAIYKKLIETKPEPLVWIQYIFFSRRIYNIHGARKIFFKARKSLNCTYHVYVAAALLEYYVNKDESVSKAIFELGLKRYSQEPSFLLQYIQFLQYKNDEGDMKDLFNKIESSNKYIPLEMWNLFVKYDKLSNNYEGVKSLLSKKLESFRDLDPTGIHNIVQRFKFLDLWPCTNEELRTFVSPEDDVEEEQEELMDKEQAEPSEVITMVMPDRSTLDVYKREVQQPTTIPQAAPQKIDPLVNLLRILPKPNEWDGPMIDIDRMVALLRNEQYVPITNPYSMVSQ